MIQRCHEFLEGIAAGGLLPSETESIGWPPWARFVQMHVSTGLDAQICFAKDLGTVGSGVGTINQAAWETARVVGPNSSAFLALPGTGQIQIKNYAAVTGSILIIFLSSLGGSNG